MNLWIVMETLFIALTLTVITTAQGQGILTVSLHACILSVLLTEQVSAVALMDLLSLSRTQLILG